ncbi:isoleucyl-tRNA synthetase [Ilyonectria robusta]
MIHSWLGLPWAADQTQSPSAVEQRGPFKLWASGDDEQHISTASFVKPPQTRLPDALSYVGEVTSALVCTPTPWTPPANKAIAVDNNLQHSLVKEPGSFCSRLGLVAKPPIEKLQEMPLSPSPSETVVESIQGSSLIGSAEYVNAFHGINGTPQSSMPTPYRPQQALAWCTWRRVSV